MEVVPCLRDVDIGQGVESVVEVPEGMVGGSVLPGGFWEYEGVVVGGRFAAKLFFCVFNIGKRGQGGGVGGACEYEGG